MKTKLQNYLIYFLILLILGVTIFFAKTIGEKVTSFQSYKSLEAIIRLAHPVHLTIDELQSERSSTSLFLASRSEENLKQVQKQYLATEQALKHFADKLNLTEMLLLTIPESELALIRKDLLDHRSKLDSPSMNFSGNYHFYNNVIVNFENFLDKMYTYSDSPEFKPLIASLMHSEFLKDSIAKECSFVSYQISSKVIKAGEIPLIKQMISEQFSYEETLRSTDVPEIQSQIKHVYASSERQALANLREQFEEKQPKLVGSLEDGKNYFASCSAYLKLFSKLDKVVIKKLEKIAQNGKEKFKQEIILVSTCGIVALLLLVGMFFLIQKAKIN